MKNKLPTLGNNNLSTSAWNCGCERYITSRSVWNREYILHLKCRTDVSIPPKLQFVLEGLRPATKCYVIERQNFYDWLIATITFSHFMINKTSFIFILNSDIWVYYWVMVINDADIFLTVKSILCHSKHSYCILSVFNY